LQDLLLGVPDSAVVFDGEHASSRLVLFFVVAGLVPVSWGERPREAQLHDFGNE
jgi:hypothetical protein